MRRPLNLTGAMPTWKADSFLLLSCSILLLNIASQSLAFLPQIIFLAVLMFKRDLMLLPSIFILLMDKSNFTFFATGPIKFSLIASLSVQNFALLYAFVITMIDVIKRKYDQGSLMLLFLIFTTTIPGYIMAIGAFRNGLGSVWQNPIVMFLIPGLYYWGISLGDTWENSKYYLATRFCAVFCLWNVFSFFRILDVFSFVDHGFMLALAFGVFSFRSGFFFKVVSVCGSFFALLNVVFAKYLQYEESSGSATSAELGSTFTRVMIVVLVLFFLMTIGRVYKRSAVRLMGAIAIVIAIGVFTYATVRSSRIARESLSGYTTWAERFEMKLVADRGNIWRESFWEALSPPYIIKDYRNQIEDNMILNYKTLERGAGIRLLPHNQILTLLCRYGWWQGGIMVVFMCCVYFRMLKCGAYYSSDKLIVSVLLATGLAVHIAVGLTGQTVLHQALTGNGMITLLLPGVLWRVYLKRNVERRMEWR